MGVYDTFVDGNHEGQVKLFDCCLNTFHKGDTVPDCNDCHTFTIAMREGGFVNIRDNVFESWTDQPLYDNVFDKYGQLWTPDSKGLMGESYLF